MDGHADVDVPVALQGRLGSLLSMLEIYLTRAHAAWPLKRRHKPPGGHVTPWWLYATVDTSCPKKSRLQFGETDHAEVNPVPHLWVRGTRDFLHLGQKILIDFLDSLSAPPAPVELPHQLFICPVSKRRWRWQPALDEWFWEDAAAAAGWTRYQARDGSLWYWRDRDAHWFFA